MTDAVASEIVSLCTAKGLTLATAESCTGGLIAAALTDVAGSSAVIDRGFVTYSNHAKSDMLGVELDSIETHGAVSTEVAEQMALGAIIHSPASLAVAVTGIAGPGGGSAEKPVGLVHLAIARRGAERAELVEVRRLMLAAAFENEGRAGVRRATVEAALQALLAAASLERP